MGQGGACGLVWKLPSPQGKAQQPSLLPAPNSTEHWQLLAEVHVAVSRSMCNQSAILPWQIAIFPSHLEELSACQFIPSVPEI